ncbi:GroES-like zinc-binding alcohol dehydrogenase family protein, putative [Theobroma cacao]|uniref:GroES-like zinc-binding alcohol dehydrogenase family protein, putative n=1 Tax=Theobroma cacao TaxID=3641 RepID=A0A061DGT0_THECC|nr:GroES-like zinc-binding alcohol dehydrogenase family protein, putative [Theobroma cacao]
MEGRKVMGWAARIHQLIFHHILSLSGVEDVMLKVLYCVVDHTDPHQMRSEIQSSNYPLVPGHEVVGEVVELGTEVNGRIFTHGGIDKDGTPTQGGFSSAMVVHRKFVGKIPEKLEPKQAAPLLCAGVTAYSALKQFKNPDKVIKAGILGLGGVGPLGVLIAKTMGHHVTVISSSEKKRMEALEHLPMHPLQPVISLLKFGGQLILVGVVTKPLAFDSEDLLLDRRKKTVTGSFLGSMEETQEVLDFWAEKKLNSMIEVVKMDYVNKAFERMVRNDVRYSFVLDIAGSNLE